MTAEELGKLCKTRLVPRCLELLKKDPRPKLIYISVPEVFALLELSDLIQEHANDAEYR